MTVENRICSYSYSILIGHLIASIAFLAGEILMGILVCSVIWIPSILGLIWEFYVLKKDPKKLSWEGYMYGSILFLIIEVPIFLFAFIELSKDIFLSILYIVPIIFIGALFILLHLYTKIHI